MTRKSRTTIIAVLLLLAVALYFISGTYARYASEFSGSAKVTAAKWAVKVAGEETETFEVELQPEKDEFIVADRIAPNYTAVGTVAVDLTGTEVAVDLSAKIGELTDTIFKDNKKISVKAEVETVGSSLAGSGDVSSAYTIGLPNGNAFTEANGKYNIKITATWENDSPTNDGIDTTTGKAGGAESVATIPVTLSLSQHIAP